MSSNSGSSSPTGGNSNANSNAVLNANSNANLTSTSTSTSSSSNTSNAPPPVITQFTLNETIDISGAQITNQQGTAANGTGVTVTTFQTTDASDVDLTLTQNLTGLVVVNTEHCDPNSAQSLLLAEIRDYAGKINCTDFQGKGTIDDYSQLFQAASKIANDVTQIKLDVDVEGFNEFGAAADELSKLFNSFIVKLQTVSIIDDLDFLRAIAAALRKIWNLSEVFGRFKETILATATVKVPQSSHDARLLVSTIMSEVDCAFTYINHFINPTTPAPAAASLSVTERLVIEKAVDTIDSWSLLCEQGVTIAMSNNPDIQYFSTASRHLKGNAALLNNNTSTLRGRLAAYNILQ
jgi:hypothetical protein